MAAYEELEGSGLLCSTESSSILARIKYKYKLSPLKYLSDKRNGKTNSTHIYMHGQEKNILYKMEKSKGR